LNSSVSNVLVTYIYLRFQQDTAEEFRREIRNLLARSLNNKSDSIRKSLERVIRMVIAATELQDSLKLLSLYHSIVEKLEPAETRAQMIDAAVEGIISILTETETESHFRDRLGKVLRDMGDKQLRSLSVDSLAERMEYSRSHFTVRVKKIIKRTPHQLIMTEKLRRAMMRLAGEDGGMSITNISECLGFSSSKEFRKIFKEAFGFCPSELPNRTKHSPVNVSERR